MFIKIFDKKKIDNNPLLIFKFEFIGYKLNIYGEVSFMRQDCQVGFDIYCFNFSTYGLQSS